MTKTILFSNGTQKEMNIEEVLTTFRGLSITTFLKARNGANPSEDERQELDIVIFKAFQTYDEEHCFSTHLIWKLRQYLAHTTVNAKRQKRDTTGIEFIDLDFKVRTGRDGTPFEIHELIEDEHASFENRVMDRDFISFIVSNLDEFEMKLLAVILGNMRIVDLAEEYNTSKQNINGKNRRFKAKLLNLINEYNA